MKSSVAAALLGLASIAYGQTSQQCQGSVCYSLNIPANTASSGTGDIFFQIQAPTSMAWVALGQGSSMSGAQIFVVYQNAAGNNVTLSPRAGSGHVEPQYSSSPQVTLLDGSGISGGNMIANVRCSNCNSWSGGTADFTKNTGSWIYAYKSGSLKSDSTSASISQHNNEGQVSFDNSKAKGGDSLNPFATSGTSNASGSSSGTVTSGARATPSACTRRNGGSGSATSGAATTTDGAVADGFPTSFPSGFPSSWPSGRPSDWASYASYWHGPHPTGSSKMRRDDDDDDCGDDDGSGTSGSSSSGAGFASVSAEYQKINMMLIAHGVLASLAFVIFFPTGAIMIRLLSFPGVIWVHAAFQIFAYLTYIAAFGLGVHLALTFRLIDSYHPVIGIILFILLAFQPILGFLHHALFKKYQMRTFWSYAHLWLGRILITLGIINGGLGLKLANNTKKGAIAYGVIAGLVWIVYVACAILGEVRRKRQPPPAYKETESPSTKMEYYGRRRSDSS